MDNLTEKKPFSGSLISRRNFLKGAGLAILGGIAGSLPERRKGFESTGEPYDIQIRNFEQKYKDIPNLKDRELRDYYVWLLSLWFGENKTSGIFTEENDPYAAAGELYIATYSIEDENDEVLRGNERNAGWVETKMVDEQTKKFIYMNLTSWMFNEQSRYTNSGATLPMLVSFRDVLTHEFVHFITIPRYEAETFNLVKEIKPEFADFANVKIEGFMMTLDPDPNNPEVKCQLLLNDFDEAATEFIANYYQRTSALTVGPPAYDNPDRPGIEKAINLLEATLKIANISMEQFADFHALSDLDGLALVFADATDRQFETDQDKVRYGLSIIVALDQGDRRRLGQYLQETKD